MTLKNVFCNLLLITIIIGCTTDDIDSPVVETPDNSLTQKRAAGFYGMPLEQLSLTTEKIIKITYHTENPFTRISIRQEFAERFTETPIPNDSLLNTLKLVLVQPATSGTTIEYWYLHNHSGVINPTAGGHMRDPDDDDDDLQETERPTTYYEQLLKEIGTHPMIDLFSKGNEEEPLDNPFDPTNPTDNPISPRDNPFNPTDLNNNPGGIQDRYQ